MCFAEFMNQWVIDNAAYLRVKDGKDDTELLINTERVYCRIILAVVNNNSLRFLLYQESFTRYFLLIVSVFVKRVRLDIDRLFANDQAEN